MYSTVGSHRKAKRGRWPPGDHATGGRSGGADRLKLLISAVLQPGVFSDTIGQLLLKNENIKGNAHGWFC